MPGVGDLGAPIGGPISRSRRCRCRGTTPASGRIRWRSRLRGLSDAYGIDPDQSASTSTGGSGTPATCPPAKLGRADVSQRKAFVQVTSVGHAGFRIDTRAGSILCDPWVNPAYFASWFPFPDNSGLDWDALGDCDYLYVSHLHKDHFDPKNLREHVNKDAVVLLPDFPVPDLQTRTGEAGLPPLLRDHRFRQAPRQRAQGRPRRDDHRAARPGRRPDRRLRPGGRPTARRRRST